MIPRLIICCAVALLFSHVARADLEVERYKSVFSFSVGNFQISAIQTSVANSGATLQRVRGSVVKTDPDAQLIVLSGGQWFGRVNALSKRRSINAFLVVAPSSTKLNDAVLRSVIDIDFRFRFDVIVNGQVIDDPIPNATVTATVGGTSTEVTADAGGNFSVELSLSSFDDFVTLDAVGGPGQEFVALRSLAGTALELHDATGSVGGASVLGADQVQSLDVTHVTTAKAVLAESVNGGPITSGDALAAAELGIDTLVLLRLATAIKIVIDNASVTLPDGVATTLELLQDRPAAEAFAAELQANNASAYGAAQAETLAGAASGGFATADVEGIVYSTILRNLGIIVGERLVFNGDGSAQRSDANGSFEATWSISPEGTLLLEPVGGQFVRPGEGFTLGCAPIVNSAVRTQTVYVGSEFNLVLRGSVLDLVTESSETFRQFPDNPECPPTDPVIAEPSFALRWLAEAGTNDYVASDFADREIVLLFWSDVDTRAPLGNAINTAGQDIFAFNADGTGSTRITGRDFTWSIDGDGHLEVTMTTGEFNEYVSLGTEIDGDVDSAINIGTTANGTFALRSFQLAVNPTFVLAPADLIGPPREFVSGNSEQNTFSPSAAQNPRSFTFNADQTWSEANGPPPLNPLWAITPDGRLEIDGQFSGGFFTQEISWIPVALVGDRYWVLEARQLGNTGDLNFVDLGTVTGFLTYYRVQP